MSSSAQSVRGRLPRASGRVQIPARVLRALHTEAPLVVLRAARGYGKSAALMTWLRQLDDGATTLYLALDRSANEPAGFWSGLHAALVDADLAAAGTAQDLEGVRGAIRATAKDVRLVLDNYHEAGLTQGAAAIDDELVELLKHQHNLSLVVAGRTMRALERAGALALDAVVVGPEALRLDADHVRELAVADGRTLTVNEAHDVAEDLGGWPAAIRAGLGVSGESFDESAATDYLTSAIDGVRDPELRTFLLRAAVLERFDVRSLEPLYPPGRSAALIARLRAAGFLRVEHEPDRVCYSYAPTVRRTLLSVLNNADPHAERNLYESLMSAATDHSDPSQALRHAVRARAWDTVADIIERDWVRLLTSDAETLVDAALAAPAEVARASARVRVARRHVAAVRGRTRSAPWSVAEHLSTTMEIASYVAAAPIPVDPEAAALVEWGVACIMTSDHGNALYAFNQAREHGLQEREISAVVLGTAGLALVHALAGEPLEARRWLRELETEGLLQLQPPQDALDLLGVAAWLTRALVAADAADADAHEIVHGMIDPRHRGDFWAIGVWIRAHAAVLNPDPDEVFQQTVQMRSALRHVPKDTLVETVLHSTVVECLLLSGSTESARELADSMTQDSIGWTARAKVHLAGQKYEQARAYALRALNSVAISARSALECHVMIAASYHGEADSDRAASAFQFAVRLARQTGQRRPFVLMKHHVFDLLAGADPAIESLWPRPGSMSQQTPALDLPTLTAREVQILRTLEHHSGPVGIAKALGLSTNTVKTHLRSVYRKLGVSTRNEALAATRSTGTGLVGG